MRVCAVLLLCVLLALPSAMAGAGAFQPGFRTLGVWMEDLQLRMDVNVWYPTLRKPSSVSYGPWELHVARNSREAEGRFPLVLLSHDSPGTRFSHYETADHLARAGFVVAALTHEEDNADNMPHLFSLRQLTGRAEQLRAALDVLLVHEDTARSIDPDRVGVLGFGVGGTAALLVGGALPSGRGWQDYCAKAGPTDPYCTDWAAPRMRRLTEALPLKASLADVRVKAVAAAAPAYGMLFDREGLRWLYPPLLLIRAGTDTFNRPSLHVDAIADAVAGVVPSPPYLADLAETDAGSLMSACPPAMRKDISALCGEASPKQRRAALRRLNSLVGRFFLETLGRTGSPRHIPAPPDISPPSAPEAKNAPVQRRREPRAKLTP